MESLDLTVLAKAAQGDLDAFEQVYRMTSGFVYNVALKMTRNTADAEDVAQEVFLSVYKNLKHFQFRSNFKTWIYRITINAAINRYRKFRKDEQHRTDYDHAVQSLSGGPSAAEKALQGEGEERLRNLLAALSPEHRACLVLREMEGLDYQEMAGALNIPLNTVRSRLKRARQALLKIARKEMIDNDV